MNRVAKRSDNGWFRISKRSRVRLGSDIPKPDYIVDPVRLLDVLRYDHKSAASLLRKRIETSFYSSLHEGNIFDRLTEPEKALIVSDINLAIDGDPLVLSEEDIEFPVRSSTRTLLKSAVTGEPAPRLNKALLEDAFPAAIRSAVGVDWMEEKDLNYFEMAKFLSKDVVHPMAILLVLFRLERQIDLIVWNELPPSLKFKVRRDPGRKLGWVSRYLFQHQLVKTINRLLKDKILLRPSADELPHEIQQALQLNLDQLQIPLINRRLLEFYFSPHIVHSVDVENVLRRLVARSRGLLEQQEVRSFERLIIGLKQYSGVSVVQELLARLSPDTRHRVLDTLPRISETMHELISELNRIVHSVAIYDEIHRDEINISEATVQLLEGVKGGEVSFEANLALLSDAFPGIFRHPVALPPSTRKSRRLNHESRRNNTLGGEQKASHIKKSIFARVKSADTEKSYADGDEANWSKIEKMINFGYERYCQEFGLPMSSTDSAAQLNFLLDNIIRRYSTLKREFTELRRKFDKLSIGLTSLGTDPEEIVDNYKKENDWLRGLSEEFCRVSDAVGNHLLGGWDDPRRAVIGRNAEELTPANSLLVETIYEIKIQVMAYRICLANRGLMEIGLLVETFEYVARALESLGEANVDYNEKLMADTDMEPTPFSRQVFQLYIEAKNDWIEELLNLVRSIDGIDGVGIGNFEIPNEELKRIRHGIFNWFLTNKRERTITRLMRLDQIAGAYCHDSGDALARGFYRDSRKYHEAIQRLLSNLARVGIHLNPLVFLEPVPDGQGSFRTHEGEPLFFKSSYLRKVARTKALRLVEDPTGTLVDVSLWGYHCEEFPELDRDSAGWLLYGW